MSNRVELRDEFLNRLIKTGKTTVSRAQIKVISKEVGINAHWFLNNPDNKVGRGEYKVPTSVVSTAPTIQMAAQVVPMSKPVENQTIKFKMFKLIWTIQI